VKGRFGKCSIWGLLIKKGCTGFEARRRHQIIGGKSSAVTGVMSNFEMHQGWGIKEGTIGKGVRLTRFRAESARGEKVGKRTRFQRDVLNGAEGKMWGKGELRRGKKGLEAPDCTGGRAGRVVRKKQLNRVARWVRGSNANERFGQKKYGSIPKWGGEDYGRPKRVAIVRVGT